MIEAMLAVAHIELPAVPRTGDYVAAQGAFAKRAASVRADAIQHVKRTVDVKHSKYPAIGNDFGTAARRNRRNIYQSDCSHCV